MLVVFSVALGNSPAVVIHALFLHRIFLLKYKKTAAFN